VSLSTIGIISSSSLHLPDGYGMICTSKGFFMVIPSFQNSKLCFWTHLVPYFIKMWSATSWIFCIAGKLEGFLIFFFWMSQGSFDSRHSWIQVRQWVISKHLLFLCYVMLWPSRGLNPLSTLPWAASSSSRRIRRLQAIRSSVVFSRQSQHAVSLINRWWAHPDSQGQTTGSVSLSR
jgi:hypothetical protein